jgi:hypothetical protein
MARGRRQCEGQLPLDFESAERERHAMLISALTLSGVLKQAALARLVFYCESRYGDAVRLPADELARRIGVTKRTIQLWVGRLVEAGIFHRIERRHQRGGSVSNLLSIDWEAVRRLTLDRSEHHHHRPATGALSAAHETPHSGAQNLGAKTADRGANRGAIFAPPIRNNLPLSSQSTTSSTPSASSVAAIRREEVEDFLKKVRELLPAPIKLEEAVEAAIDAGVTLEELRARCRWFQKNQIQWREAGHRPGVLYTGLKEAKPGLPSNRGWPYQR